ncbi:cryptochrome/photolyase family protein [Leucothrix mucor]|uniref:cryptochrome/photolyase family protein n=1 Tax=Leucothrix mucor TaxID=45248 RepID=UPI0003B3BE49|nr:deoxyribodipyrimidine photo-lyase [Leucothrix mucor]
MSTAIFWFRQDLRLSDNPAFLQACEQYTQVLPIYIDDYSTQDLPLGEASRVWLHHSLDKLKHSLQDHHSDLLLFQGDAKAILMELVSQLDAEAVLWNRCYDPHSIERDTAIKAALKAESILAHSENASLLNEPWQILKKDGTPYRVYTPYWKQVHAAGLERLPSPTPSDIPKPPKLDIIEAISLDDLSLLPDRPWGDTMLKSWEIGEAAADSRLTEFLEKAGAQDYKDVRDFPATSGTSRLSPHLHFGEISPRQIIYRTLQEIPLSELDKGTETFLKEVVWREFAYYVLYHFPETQQQAMYPQFNNFPWRTGDEVTEHLAAWQHGKTGYPIIDAGMRELWATGWMHNRVRMIVASFLAKNLLISWQVGEAWFRDTLVDADSASNAFGWQWASGCGADAAPYFRIFNPVTQSKKFDPKGDYIRRWIPELRAMNDKFIHEPWLAPATQLANSKYPEPIVDLSATRQRALDAYAVIRKSEKPE